MKPVLVVACLGFVMFLSVAAGSRVAEADPVAPTMRNMSIVTGGSTGTYIKFGQQIAGIVSKECGATLDVKTSSGSLDNLKRLRYESFTQLGIVQEDALDFVRTNPDVGEFSEYIGNFNYVFSLYPEEVHIVTRGSSSIRDLKDLQGKTVAIGKVNSGTYLTATTILALGNVRLGRVVEKGGNDALELLFSSDENNQIDAMFYVAGKPVNLFAQSDFRDQLQFVSIQNEKVRARYTNISRLTKSDYSWITEPVETVAVMSVLVSYDFKGEQCQNVGMVANLIRKNLEELRRTGHPKWGAVDLSRPVTGWQRYKCAEEYENRRVVSDGARQCVFSDFVDGPGGVILPDEELPCDHPDRTDASEILCNWWKLQGSRE